MWGRSSIIVILLETNLPWQTKKLLHEVMVFFIPEVLHEALDKKSI